MCSSVASPNATVSRAASSMACPTARRRTSRVVPRRGKCSPIRATIVDHAGTGRLRNTTVVPVAVPSITHWRHAFMIGIPWRRWLRSQACARHFPWSRTVIWT
jgi:hypothetical protein